MTEIMCEPEHLVITVHGIRTFGKWQSRLEKLLNPNTNRLEVFNYTFGYFSLIAFIIPPLRWIVVRRFKIALLSKIYKRQYARIDLIGHSFGTHIIAWALISALKDGVDIHINTLILAGSVLKPTFNWGYLLDQGRVVRVINDCGVSDNVLVINQFFVLFTGMAGRIGFQGLIGRNFKNRYFYGGHSLYFERDNKDYDQFMDEYWVPLIVDNLPIIEIDQRKTLSWFEGVTRTVIQNFDFIKLCIYSAILITPAISLLVLFIRSEERAHDLLLSKAFSLPYLIERDGIGKTFALSIKTLLDYKDSPKSFKNFVEFSFQRFETKENLLNQLEFNVPYNWHGSTYIKNNNNILSKILDTSLSNYLKLNNIILFIDKDKFLTFLNTETYIVFKYSLSDYYFDDLDEQIVDDFYGAKFFALSNNRIGIQLYTYASYVGAMEPMILIYDYNINEIYKDINLEPISFYRIGFDYLCREVIDDSELNSKLTEIKSKYNFDYCPIEKISNIQKVRSIEFPMIKPESKIWKGSNDPHYDKYLQYAYYSGFVEREEKNGLKLLTKDTVKGILIDKPSLDYSDNYVAMCAKFLFNADYETYLKKPGITEDDAPAWAGDNIIITPYNIDLSDCAIYGSDKRYIAVFKTLDGQMGHTTHIGVFDKNISLTNYKSYFSLGSTKAWIKISDDISKIVIADAKFEGHDLFVIFDIPSLTNLTPNMQPLNLADTRMDDDKIDIDKIVAISNNNKILAVINNYNDIMIYDYIDEKYKFSHYVENEKNDTANSISFYDNNKLIVGYKSGDISLYDIKTGTTMWHQGGSLIKPSKGNTEISPFRFHVSDNKNFILAVSNSKTYIIDPFNGLQLSGELNLTDYLKIYCSDYNWKMDYWIYEASVRNNGDIHIDTSCSNQDEEIFIKLFRKNINDLSIKEIFESSENVFGFDYDNNRMAFTKFFKPTMLISKEINVKDEDNNNF